MATTEIYPIVIRVAGVAGDYGAYVMEFKGEQLLVKHIIIEHVASIWEALRIGNAYKAEHPTFNWKAGDAVLPRVKK